MQIKPQLIENMILYTYGSMQKQIKAQLNWKPIHIYVWIKTDALKASSW